MKIVVQRVKAASVTVEEELVGSIQQGLCLLVGLHHSDTLEEVTQMYDL